MNKDFEAKRDKWLAENGFNKNLITYVYFPDNSYEIKEQLKEDGFRFSKNLYWHTPELKDEYRDACLEICLDDVAEISAWGTGYFKENAKEYIEKKMFDARGEKEGEWLGDPATDVGSKIQVRATLVCVADVETKYGMTQLVKFVDELGNNITWWTTVDIKFEVGTLLDVAGTIKSFDRYKNKKITVLKRCKLTEVK